MSASTEQQQQQQQQQQSPQATVTPNDPKRPIGENDIDDVADTLSPKQWQAIELLAAGKRVSDVVAESGVSRKTLYRWRHEDADFIAAFQARRREIWSVISDRLRALLPVAIEILAGDLAESDWDANKRKSALALLRLPMVTRAIVLKPEDGDDRNNGGGGGGG